MLFARTSNVVVSAPATMKSGSPPLQPLGDVLALVLDKDKDGKVTMEEVTNQLVMLEQLFQGGSEEGSEYLELLRGVKAGAPKMFELLDSNSDKGLTKKELTYVTKFETSLKNRSMRTLLRDWFGILDTNEDDKLSVDELFVAIPSDGGSSEALTKMTAKLHELFPLRSTSQELEAFVQTTLKSIGGNSWDKESVAVGMKWIDDDGDGFIQRKEVGKAYNTSGKKFLEIAQTIKQMGPMLALFGGMNADGNGKPSSNFKMDL